MKIAIIGCGRIARVHLSAIEATPGIALHAVADSDVQAARVLSEIGGCQYFEGHQALLNNAPPNIAVVCTPPATHAVIVADCLHAGAHVLCEKPLGIAPSEVEALNALSVSCGRALMMASKFRFVPAVRRAGAAIAAGELGDIEFYRSTFVSMTEMNGRMNASRALSGGGVLMDNGPHAFDVARFLLGEIIQVRAEFPPNRQPVEVEDSVHISFQTASMPDWAGAIKLSWSEDPTSDCFLEIGGTRGTITIQWSEYDKAATFAAQMRHFAAVARGEAAPMVSPTDALANARVIAAAYQAERMGDWGAVEAVETFEVK